MYTYDLPNYYGGSSLVIGLSVILAISNFLIIYIIRLWLDYVRKYYFIVRRVYLLYSYLPMIYFDNFLLNL